MEFTPQVVWDRRRRLTFDGALLARCDSRRPYAPRWAVLELYRLPSDSPAYVFARQGHSRVFHRSDCSEVRHDLPFGHELHEQALGDADELSPCRTCAPSRPAAWSDPDFATSHRFEVTKFFATVCAGVPELLSELCEPSAAGRGAGVGFQRLPWLSRRLLTDAAACDERIAAALR